tara:strand:+ start:4838 stop:5425 length:588 start_codon:yes stop_codon:yes gene_type:complete
MTAAHPQYRADTFRIAPYGSIEIGRDAEFFICLDATAPFLITFDDAPQTSFAKGLVYEAQVPFLRTRIENPNDSEISVSIGMGRGGVKDARLVLSGAVETTEVAASRFDTPAPVVAVTGVTTELAAIDGTRKEVVLKNLSTTERVWIKNANTIGAVGMPLDGKEGLILTTTAAIYAYNPNGVDVQVAVLNLGTSA